MRSTATLLRNLHGQEQDMVLLLVQCCTDALSRGVRIIAEDWGIYVTRQRVYAAEGERGFGPPGPGDRLAVDPLGALLLGRRRKYRELTREVEELLEVSSFWIWGFQSGYDGETIDEETAGVSMNYAHGYHVGCRIREIIPPSDGLFGTDSRARIAQACGEPVPATEGADGARRRGSRERGAPARL